MKVLCQLLLLILIATASCAAQSRIEVLQDSLWNIIHTSGSQEEIALAHSFLAYHYKNYQHLLDSTFWHADEAIRLATGPLKDKTIMNGYKDKGWAYEYKNDYENALLEYDKSLEISLRISHWENASRIYSAKAAIFNRRGKYAAALEYFNLGYQTIQKAQPSRQKELQMALHNRNVALVYGRMGDRSRSAVHYQLALTDFERLKDTTFLMSVCGNLCNVYLDLSDYEKVQEYALKLIGYAQAAKIPVEEASGWRALGMRSVGLKDCEGARDAWEKAVAALEKTTRVVPLPIQYSILLLKVHVGLSCDDFDLAMAAIDEIWPLADKLQGDYIWAFMEIYRCYAHLGRGDLPAARAAWESSRQYVEKANIPTVWQEYYKVSALLHARAGDFHAADLAFKLHDSYLDSLSNAVLVRKTAEIEQVRKNQVDSVRRAGELAFKEKTFALELLQKQQQLVQSQLERQLQDEALKVLEQEGALKDLDLLRRAEVLRTERLRNQLQSDSLGRVQANFEVQSLVVERQRLWIGLLLALGVIAALAGRRLYQYYRKRSMLQLRTTLARDLHDDLGSEMSALALGSFAAAQSGEPEHMRTVLHEVATQTQKLIDDMRDMVWSLHPDNDALDKMSARMQQYAANNLEPQGIELRFEIQPVLLSIKMEPEARKHLYLLFKEAINNAARYAQCSRVSILMEKAPLHFIIQIRDDGIGFDPGQITRGNGLRNMQERAALLGGQLEVKSAPGQGTSLYFRLPLR